MFTFYISGYILAIIAFYFHNKSLTKIYKFNRDRIIKKENIQLHEAILISLFSWLTIIFIFMVHTIFLWQHFKPKLTIPNWFTNLNNKFISKED